MRHSLFPFMVFIWPMVIISNPIIYDIFLTNPTHFVFFQKPLLRLGTPIRNKVVYSSIVGTMSSWLKVKHLYEESQNDIMALINCSSTWMRNSNAMSPYQAEKAFCFSTFQPFHTSCNLFVLMFLFFKNTALGSIETKFSAKQSSLLQYNWSDKSQTWAWVLRSGGM